MFGIYSRLIAFALVAALLAGGAWKAYHSGYNARDTIARADDAARVADALQASETARLRERSMRADFAKVDHELQANKTRRDADAVVIADKLRTLQNSLAAKPAGFCAGDPSGIDAADPRPTIAGECAGQLVALDRAYGKLADQAKALQGIAAIVRVK